MSRPKRTQPKIRLNLEITEATKEGIDRIREAIQADSTTEVVRRAVGVYDYLWGRIISGEELVVRSKNGKDKKLLLL